MEALNIEAFEAGAQRHRDAVGSKELMPLHKIGHDRDAVNIGARSRNAERLRAKSENTAAGRSVQPKSGKT